MSALPKEKKEVFGSGHVASLSELSSWLCFGPGSDSKQSELHPGIGLDYPPWSGILSTDDSEYIGDSCY